MSLKPCPHCGHAASFHANRPFRAFDTGETEVGMSISCPNCPTEMLVTADDATHEQLEDMWNRRASCGS